MISLQDAYKASQRERAAFEKVRYAERQYAAQLRKIAKHIEDLFHVFPPDDPQTVEKLTAILRRYSEIIRPWANAVVRRLLAEVNRRDEKAWFAYSKLMGVQVQHQIQQTPVGHVFQQLMNEQVTLITSLPLDAAQKVHELAIKAQWEGGRAVEIKNHIMQTGLTTRYRANLIARTETGRAATLFAQARAQSIGSTGYVWRSSKDRRTRPRHRDLEGTFHKWTEPPIASEPGQKIMKYHPGAGPNCRCYVEPVLPEVY